MSEPLRIGFVVEGVTDRLILEAAIIGLLAGHEYVAEQLSPELSETLAPVGGGGWTSVYFWCRQAAEQAGGQMANNMLLKDFDLIVVQVDADFAEKRYSDDQRISSAPGDLPCVRPCPPASATTDALRSVVAGWMGKCENPPQIVVCTPSKDIDAWVFVALFPENRFASASHVECHSAPGAQLQARPLGSRLIRNGRKQVSRYRAHAPTVTMNWPRVRATCDEAERFSVDVAAVLGARSPNVDGETQPGSNG